MPKKIAFLDRDGVINKKAKEHSYITNVKEFIFNETIFDVLLSLKKENFEFIILTNQRGIARGLYSEETLAEIHTFMCKRFLEKGISILDIFYCPHNENACECRKPKDGMLKAACLRYDIDLKDSIFITDSILEMEMGKNFGISNSYFVPSDAPHSFLRT